MSLNERHGGFCSIGSLSPSHSVGGQKNEVLLSHWFRAAPWCSCCVWSVAGAALPHLKRLSSVQFTVMCENKLISLFTSHSDVRIVCQLLKHSESSSGSEQCQWPDAGLGSSLHANALRSRSANRGIWHRGEKRITRMSQLHLDCAGELSVCDKACLIKQDRDLGACWELIPAVCFCSVHVLFLFPSAKETLGEGCRLPAACSGGTKQLQPWAPPVTEHATT